MLRNVLRVFCVLFLEGMLVSSRLSDKTYEDHYFYTTYNDSNVTWMMMPDDNGVVVSAVISGLFPDKKITIEDVHFHLWTRKNPRNAEVSTFDNDKAAFLKFDKINTTNPTIFLIHGFTDNTKESEFFDVLVDAFLKYGDYNVIGVNWMALASVPWYGQAVENTFFVGLLTAQAISLVRGLSPNKPTKVHVVGYNLGALVAAVAGDNIRYRMIERITALDPVYIHTSHLPGRKKLSRHCADLVEVIHTSANYIGIYKPAGHRDFYPNGGKWPQPGCMYDLADRCSPRRAFQYYAEALTTDGGFLATKCKSYKDFRRGKCDDETKIGLVNNVSSSVTGKFYLLTGSEPPFSDLGLD